MRQTGWFKWILAAVVAAASLAWLAEVNHAAQPGPGPTVVVVNLERLFANLEERESQESNIQAFIEEQNKKIEDIDARRQAVQEELQLLPEGAPEEAELLEELVRLQVDLRFQNEFSERLIDRRRARAFAELFEKVRDAASRLAERNGYDLVLSNDAGAAVPDSGEAQVRAALVSRRVLFSAPSLDVTDDLVRLMNNEWAAGQAGP